MGHAQVGIIGTSEVTMIDSTVVAQVRRPPAAPHSQTLVIPGDSDRMREKRESGLWTPPTDGKEPPGEQRQRPTRGVRFAGVWGVNFSGA
jgi:hypothetical protein